MKNKEKYAKEIIEIASVGHIVAVNRDGRPCDCVGCNCNQCMLQKDNQGICHKSRKEWFESEAKKTQIEVINEELEKISRERGRLYNTNDVVGIIKRIQYAERKEVKSDGIL